MKEEAFLLSALQAIQAQQSVIQRCSDNIARTLQENNNALHQLRASIAALNELVGSVQEIARPPPLPLGGKRRMVPYVELPAVKSSKSLSSSQNGTSKVNKKGKGKAGRAEGSQRSRETGSSGEDVERALGSGRDHEAREARRSETLIVRPRKRQRQVEMGFDFGDRPLYPPSYFASPSKVCNAMDAAELASDVESLPASDMDEQDLGDTMEEEVLKEESPDEPVRGREDLLAPECLPESSREKSKVKWPVKGKNTPRGRMQQISCDMCEAVFHWACGGFEDTDVAPDGSWRCPECEDMLKTRRHRQIQVAQKERCNRPDCIMRALKSVRKPGDEDHFVFDRIVGRKMLKRDNKAKRVYQYLVLWDQYPIHDCTWEPARAIPSLERFEADFLAECERQGINTRGTVLLPEATDVWNEEGRRRRKMLIAQGVVPGTWWEGDDDPEE